MIYNLTGNQKELAKWVLHFHLEGKLPETFKVSHGVMFGFSVHRLSLEENRINDLKTKDVTLGSFEALADAGLLKQGATKLGDKIRGHPISSDSTSFTIMGGLEKAVNSNFAEESTSVALDSISHRHPLVIAMSLERLRAKYPDAKKLGFLVMRFAAEKPYARIVDVIKKTAEGLGLAVVRADEHEFHGNLLNNVRTYLHGCGFGIALYERITTEEPNANVGLEVGYLMAMEKPVLLLKDKTVPTLQTDLAGELYKEFDPHDPEGTIPAQLTKWLEDYGIVVPRRT